MMKKILALSFLLTALCLAAGRPAASAEALIASETVYNAEGLVETVRSFQYDESGRLLRESFIDQTAPDPSAVVVEFDRNGARTDIPDEITDSLGHRIGFSDAFIMEGCESPQAQLNEDRRVVTLSGANSYGGGFQYSYSYDAQGRFVSYILEARYRADSYLSYSNDYTWLTIMHFAYDDAGNTTVQVYRYADGNGGHGFRTFTYDSRNNLTAVQEQYLHGSMGWIARMECAYDDAGTLLRCRVYEDGQLTEEAETVPAPWSYYFTPGYQMAPLVSRDISRPFHTALDRCEYYAPEGECDTDENGHVTEIRYRDTDGALRRTVCYTYFYPQGEEA